VSARVLVGFLLATVAATTVAASGARVGRGVSANTSQDPDFPFTPYDGRFTFVRIRFDAAVDMGRGRFGGGGEPPWHHDYPYSERNLTAVLTSITNLRASPNGNVLRLDDPLIFRYPILYLSEPGFWNPSDTEVAALRAYLQKGGFIIFDDFGERRGRNDWENFSYQMQRVVPDLRPMQLDGSEPVWNTFFNIGPEGLNMRNNMFSSQPVFFGFFEDNDKSKRQIAIANFNNDIGEFMDYNASGFFPVDLTNEAYKIGVDFILYAITH
jgi:hypothetical protein